MGERDDALRTIADARTRLSALADELGRRAAPEHVKEVAREMVTGRAEEFKHMARERARDKMDEMKHHAKEVAMRRTQEWKHEMTDTPRGMGFLGALLGAGVGSLLAKKIFEVRHREHDYRGGWREDERDWGYERAGGRYSAAYSSEDQRYHDTRPLHEAEWRERDAGATWQQTHEQEGPGMGERASATAQNVKERASETMHNVKERASETMHSVKERASGMMGSARERASGLRERYASHEGSGRDFRGQASDWYGRAVNEQPVALAIGAFAFGALAAALLPVTSRERQVLEPARRKAEEAVSQVGGRIEERLGISGSQEQQQSGSQQPWSGQGSVSSRQDYNTYGTEETASQGSDDWRSGRMETAGTSGTREWNDRRDTPSSDPSVASSTSGSVAASSAMTAGTSPESGTPNPPTPGVGELGKSHSGR